MGTIVHELHERQVSTGRASRLTRAADRRPPSTRAVDDRAPTPVTSAPSSMVPAAPRKNCR
jgi:hypothetical protein